MKVSHLAAAVVALTGVLVGTSFLLTTDEQPGMTRIFVGCYRPTYYSGTAGIRLTASGDFVYNQGRSSFVVYKDKLGLALLTKNKIIAEEDGTLRFINGHPFLLRVDQDNHGFTVPTNTGLEVRFRRVKC